MAEPNPSTPSPAVPSNPEDVTSETVDPSTPPSPAPSLPAFTASNCQVVTTRGTTASGDDGDGSVAANTQDDNPGTRWSALGKGSWLTLDLGTSQTLNATAIAWHQGATRQNQFTLDTSTDGTTFTPAHTGTSTLTAAAQTYAFT
ncbi:MAG: discoidin domain-containing protein, partial [Cystobacter sp.]